MTKRILIAAAGLTIFAGLIARPTHARESWPQPGPDVKARLDSYNEHEKEVIAKDKPIIEEWAKKGKPYIPWASNPGDLPQAGIPAFPGAEGGGMYSFGGRGGKVYVVTSLEDSGPGTLREACEAAGPRIVVFAVSGIIHLKMPIFIEAPYITIAGQTAPGDGICIADQGIDDNARRRDPVFAVAARNKRHFQPTRDSLWESDRKHHAGSHLGELGIGSEYRYVSAYVSAACRWAGAETSGRERDDRMVHHERKPLNTWNHAFGGDWGGCNTMFHHNLIACNTGRNPSIAMTFDFNFVNNVLFNWRHRTVDGGDEHSLINMINNYYKPGPVTPDSPLRYRIVEPAVSWSKSNPVSRWGKVYASGNYVEGNPEVTADNWDGGIQFVSKQAGPQRGRQGSDRGFGQAQCDHREGEGGWGRSRCHRCESRCAVRRTRTSLCWRMRGRDAAELLGDPVDERVAKEVETGVTWGMGKVIPVTVRMKRVAEE